MSLILGIESTCDETAAALVADGRVVQASVVATQVALHARYRGVVPEIASRAHINSILPVLIDAIAAAGIKLSDIDAVAVANRPGLIGSLLVGVTAGKTLAWSLNKPLVPVDHVHAHLYSVVLAGPAEPAPPASPADVQFPAVGMVCSGGHTSLFHLRNWLDIELIGATIDDAVGEAYDKVAAILELGYPGGPILDNLAAGGDSHAIPFPRTLLERDSLDFSFSGLKTAVLYHVRGHKGRERRADSLTGAEIANVAASFQAACIDVLIVKIRRAARQYGARTVLVGGGVSANRGLRAALAQFDIPVRVPPLPYCTDNAAMSAALAHHLLAAKITAGLDLEAFPSSLFAI
jgi:N6-L-threonylcarbamoyladenine synthase